MAINLCTQFLYSVVFSVDLRLFGCKAILLEPGGFKTSGATKEVLAESFSKSWAGAPPEVKEEYGQEYADYCEFLLKNSCTGERPVNHCRSHSNELDPGIRDK